MLSYWAALINFARLSFVTVGRLGFLIALSATNLAATAFATEDRVRVAGFTESDAGVLCGPLTLAFAIRLLGDDATVHEIVDQVELTHEGTSLNELQIAARERGYAAEGFTLESVQSVRSLTEDTPAIVQLRGSHFGAVWSRDDKIHLVEFPYQLRTISQQTLEAQWNPTILVIRRPETPGPFKAPKPMLPTNSVLIPGGALLLTLTVYVAAVRIRRIRAIPRTVHTEP